MKRNPDVLSVHSVFVTNNGLSDHIGVSQVLPYLEGLAHKGHRISCVSVEHPSNASIFNQDIKPRLIASGIGHYPIVRSLNPFLRKLERFSMTYQLKVQLKSVILGASVDLIHCRSYMPLAAVMPLSQKLSLPFIFDMRGFWIDERLESGAWDKDRYYWKVVANYFRRLEQKALKNSAGIVVLTEDAKKAIVKHSAYGNGKIAVIPCSVNQSTFKPKPKLREKNRLALGLTPDDVVLAYLGSAGPLYRIDILYKLAVRLKARGVPVRILFLGTHSVQEHINRAKKLGVNLAVSDIRCCQVPHEKVPDTLSAADFGISFRIQEFSSLGVSATKVGEYLACGLPVISNKGVGDIDHIIEDGKTGLILPDFGDKSINLATNFIAAGSFHTSEYIRTSAQKKFDMEQAVDLYDSLYQSIGIPAHKKRSGGRV